MSRIKAESLSIMGLAIRDPFFQLLPEHAHRDRTVFQYAIVESANIKARTQLFFRLRAELENLHLADLVRQRLPGPRDVAVNLGDDVLLGQPGVVLHEIDGLLPRPAKVVHPGIDDEPAGAPSVEG